MTAAQHPEGARTVNEVRTERNPATVASKKGGGTISEPPYQNSGKVDAHLMLYIPHFRDATSKQK